MSLWARLALSYLAVMVIFFGVLALAAPLFTGAHPPHPQDVLQDLKRNIDGSPEPLEEAVRKACSKLKPGTRVTLFPQKMAITGPIIEVEAEPLDQAMHGQVVARMPEEGGFAALVPLRQNQAVLAIDAPPPPTKPYDIERAVNLGYVRAGMLATLICALVGLAFSRAVTKPLRRLVQATESFGPDRLTARIDEGGPVEVAELSRSFNRMADRLQETVETLRSSEAARREFLGDVSHNLMTPLAASMGWVQAMLDGMVRNKDEERRHLERIMRELTFVSRSVRRLLELSRWEQSDPELRFEVFPLTEPLLEVAETLESSAASRNVQLAFEGLDPRWRVEGDRGRVRELLQILIENAVLHGGRDTTVRVVTEQKAGRVWITVADNGFGIPAEDLPMVKKGFRRSSGRNTGLGLAIADRLARSHGGVLELESATGQGTTVRFSLRAVED